MSDIYNMLERMAHAISKTFGDNCEVVIHDLKRNLDNTIVFIENGHVTNRKLGDGASALVMDSITKKEVEHEDKLNYIIRDSEKYIKCSSLFFKEETELRYIFAINYDVTHLIKTQEVIQSLVVYDVEPNKFPTDVNEMLDRLIVQSIEKVGKPIKQMNYKEKSIAIKYLNDCGAFLITKAADKVAEVFGISKYTIYNHMK